MITNFPPHIFARNLICPNKPGRSLPLDHFPWIQCLVFSLIGDLRIQDPWTTLFFLVMSPWHVFLLESILSRSVQCMHDVSIYLGLEPLLFPSWLLRRNWIFSKSSRLLTLFASSICFTSSLLCLGKKFSSLPLPFLFFCGYVFLG